MTLLSTSKEQLLDLKNKKIKRCLSLLLSSTSVLPAHTQYRHGIGISQMSPPVCMVVHSRSKSWGNLGWVAWWQMPANASARVWTTIHLKSSGQLAFFYQAALFWNSPLSNTLLPWHCWNLPSRPVVFLWTLHALPGHVQLCGVGFVCLCWKWWERCWMKHCSMFI